MAEQLPEEVLQVLKSESEDDVYLARCLRAALREEPENALIDARRLVTLLEKVQERSPACNP